ncbi:VOC family protein [bacterium]|nr:VOC family protein [bacterium]
MIHRICHVELPCGDMNRISEFYRKVFQWEIKPVPGMDYLLFGPGVNPGGGFFRRGGDQPDAVIPYILVDEIKDAVSKITDNGGEIILPETPVADMGFFALFKDPEGNVMGLWADAKK